MPVIDIAAVVARVQAAEEAALNEVADRIAADAKARAPVRKVFKEAKGFRRKFRSLTGAEKAHAIRRANAYYTSFGFRRVFASLNRERPRGGGRSQYEKALFNYSHAELRRLGSANNLSRSRALRDLGPVSGHQARAQKLLPLLTSRGKYEVSSGRALHQVVSASGNSTSVHVGGRLKASIGNEGVVQQGEGMVAKVSARVRYAKFVEFPTTHNASQPFLLPALHANRGRLKQALARELKKNLGG